MKPHEKVEKTIQNEHVDFIQTSSYPETFFIIIDEIQQGYSLAQDMACRVQLIPFTTKWQMQVDGYRCLRDGVKSASCFAYDTLITFMESDEKLESDLSPNLEGLIDKDFLSKHLENLQQGSSLLLKIIVDQRAALRYKRVVDYLIQSGNDNQTILDSYFEQNAQFYTGVYENVLKTCSPEYLQLSNRMDKVYDKFSQFKPTDVVLVYGSSNTGKSKLIHHLINRQLSTSASKNVFYLECDPGQTEFGPCGTLSLVEIKDNICSPPGFKFMFKDDFSFLSDSSTNLILSKPFGAITADSFAESYIDLIQDLFQHFKSNCKGTLFINTMGWIVDCGLDLLVKIVELTKPNIVLRTSDANTDLPVDQSTETISSNNLKQLERLGADITTIFHLKPVKSFRMFRVPFCSLPFKKSPFKSGIIRREINQLSYLVAGMGMQTTYKPFYALKPYR